MSSTSIKQAIQNIQKHGEAELLQGTVTAVSPLTIRIASDSKLVISENITVVPRHLTDYETTIDIEWGGETTIDSTTTAVSAHAHKLEDFNIIKAKAKIRNALEVGDKVHVLAVQGGKKYYVLDRVKK